MNTLALTLTGIVLGLTTLFGQAQLNETTLNAQIINEDGWQSGMLPPSSSNKDYWRIALPPDFTPDNAYKTL